MRDAWSSRSIRAVLFASVAAGLLWGLFRLLGGDRILAPRPETIPDLAASFEVVTSTLTVPVRIQLATLVDKVEGEIPVEWGDLEDRLQIPDNDRATVAMLLRRAPFQVSFTDTTVQLSTTVAYSVRGWYELPFLPDVSVSCGTGEGEPQPRLNVSLEGPVSLTEDWRLSTATRVAELEAASDADRDRCEVTFAGIDITGRVVDAARSFLEGHTAAIDSLVGEADVRSQFEEWWTLLRDPIRIRNDVWLELRPIAVGRGDVQGEGDVVEIMATLVASPRITLGAEPPRWPQTLPPLGESSGGDRLDILVEAVAEYGATSRRLNEALVGLSIERAGRRLFLRSVDIAGIGGGQVALEVSVEGDIEGRLFLVGTPVYDPETTYVSVPDLSFAVSTSNLLVSGASWIADAGFEAILQERARWPVETAIDWATDELREGLNRTLRDGVRLEGTVGSLRILGVTALRDGLFVRAAADAQATLIIEDGA